MRDRTGSPVNPPRYAWPADIWAMGVILYELCALKLPFDGGRDCCRFKRVLNGLFCFAFGRFWKMLQVDRFAVQGSNMVVLVQSIIRGTAPPLPEDGLRDVLRAALQEEQKQYLQISAVLKQMIIV